MLTRRCITKMPMINENNPATNTKIMAPNALSKGSKLVDTAPSVALKEIAGLFKNKTKAKTKLVNI